MNKCIDMVWSDGARAKIMLFENPAADYYARALKHLQHLELCFGARENPYAQGNMSVHELTDHLISLGHRLDVDIDTHKLTQQSYLNWLHEIYLDAVRQVPWDPAWLEFHDSIHLLEIRAGHHGASDSIWFDYGPRAGLLEQPFDRSWLKFAHQQAPAGTCFLRPHELGKNLITCWQDQETNTAENLCRLAKPWTRLRPLLDLATRDIKPSADLDPDQRRDFLTWFAPVRDAWCQHWQIPDWTVEELFGIIPIGKIDDLELVQKKFMSYNYPMRLRPCQTPL